MKINEYGICFRDEQELIDEFYIHPSVSIHKAISNDLEKEKYNKASQYYYMDNNADYLTENPAFSLENFHKINQNVWLMPGEYESFDIYQFLINSCKTEVELERVAHEIGLFEERNLIQLLRYIKYLVDTMRQHNIVWGVGRGSASASYVLFKIGIHKIDSIKYNLDVSEFFKG
jgi:DNA polymerase III alpha subunit